MKKTLKIIAISTIISILIFCLSVGLFFYGWSYSDKWRYEVDNFKDHYKNFEVIAQVADKIISYDSELHYLKVYGDNLYNPNTDQDVVLTNEEKECLKKAREVFKNGESHLDLIHVAGFYTLFSSDTKRYSIIYSAKDEDPKEVYHYWGVWKFDTKKIMPNWYHAVMVQ